MLGARLKKSRERLGWSQSELARRAGVPQPFISQLESGQRDSITTDNARRLARALGVGVDYLIGTWDYEETPESAASRSHEPAAVLAPRGVGRLRG